MLTGAVVGLLLLLVVHVPVGAAVSLAVAAALATCFSWWADRVWRRGRERREP